MHVRSALADTLLCYDEPPSLHVECCTSLFLRRSRGSPARTELDLLSSSSTFRLTPCVLGVSSMVYGSHDTTNNVAEYWGIVHGLRQAKTRQVTTHHCMSLRTVRLCFRNSEHDTLHASSTSYGYLKKPAPSITILMWHHYCIYNIMADHMANIAIDTGASIQAHAPVNQETTSFLGSDVNYWLETSQSNNNKYRAPY